MPDPDGSAVAIRRRLDLDSGTARIAVHLVADHLVADHLVADPLIGPLVERGSGLELIGYPDEFEAVVATVVGQ